MNLLHPFRKDIKRQLQEYVDWKASTKGTPIAIEHKECLLTFISVAHLSTVEDLVIEHVYDFKDWLLNRYGSTYTFQKHMHVVQCFLRFYRKFAIISEMTKLGRKPNVEMIKTVKEYRKKNLTYRDLQKLLELKHGRVYNLKTLNFWGNYNK